MPRARILFIWLLVLIFSNCIGIAGSYLGGPIDYTREKIITKKV